MSRQRAMFLNMATGLASVSAVSYSVTHYTRAAYEEADTQRTQALVEQFQKEFAQLREQVARQVEYVSNSEVTLKMAIDLFQQHCRLGRRLWPAGPRQEDCELLADFPREVNFPPVIGREPVRIGGIRFQLVFGPRQVGGRAFAAIPPFDRSFQSPNYAGRDSYPNDLGPPPSWRVTCGPAPFGRLLLAN